MSILKRVVRVRHLELTVIVGNCLKYDKVAVQRPFNFEKGVTCHHIRMCSCLYIYLRDVCLDRAKKSFVQ